ncbi:DUF4136 domain-containing protein [Glacieibacterium sp.]|uniref:DUF4136 domain-containing protein n=1 Tax=Glacieibacterium sp. TaxID=2860237 RepID=UPI003B003AE9
MLTLRKLLVPAAALTVLAGCTTGPSGTDVTRFHLGQPIARGAIAVVPANPNMANDLEFRTYAEAVGNELRNQNFTPVYGNDQSSPYVGVITIEQVDRPGATRRTGLSIGLGLGGGSFGRRGGGFGGGAGVQVPVGGHTRTDYTRVNTLGLQIKRRSDSSIVWEGRATAARDDRNPSAQLPTAIPELARDLLADFPGPANQTVHYKGGRR